VCDTESFDGVALSTGVLDALKTLGVRIVQCRWRYGIGARLFGPFQPHYELAGAFTTLEGHAGAGFDGFDGWYPGDHKGCLCSVVPVFGPDGLVD